MIEHRSLDVTEVEFDFENPRITPLLEAYEDPSPEVVAFALQPGDAKFLELRQAIRTNNGIVHPIVVNQTEGRWIAIEGNTRLAIYKQLHEERPDDLRWKQIPALIHKDMDPAAVDAIRLQAHLVGVRNWSPFAKARYLYKLNEQQLISFAALAEFCGGNNLEVQRNINAYRDIIQYYQPLVSEDEFDERKFSLFFEAQKTRIRECLIHHGFTVKDVAQWVVDGRFEPRQELIRKLPQILDTPRAREEFFKSGASKAEEYIDRPEVIQELQSVSLANLCAAIQKKIADLPYRELKEIQASPELVQAVEDAITDLTYLNEHELQGVESGPEV